MGVSDWLNQYDANDITIATAASHSSLQIFHAAKKRGFKTLALASGDRDLRYYDAYPLARPDEIWRFDDWSELASRAEELRARNAIIVPHGSLIEYMGTEAFEKVEVPVYGNRKVLEWESNRDLERGWLEDAGVTMPKLIENPKDIDEPVIVKYHGAKGGKGFFIAKSPEEYHRQIQKGEPHTIQEFVMGTRYYLHYFHSRLDDDGFQIEDSNGEHHGQLQMLSIDRRDESNIDELNRIGSINELNAVGIDPTFVVTGNIPMVIRESLLPEVFRMGEGVVRESYDRFGGLWGPFCLETIVTPDLEFKVFEISARIVAGTNPFIGGSSYSEMIQPGMSTGDRIAQDIHKAANTGKLSVICT
jgi:5-formaminoimidazole-4-carboxamide-1-(beta)-D-ribofuranosyl 5'-monophosphate synthetase